MVFQALPRGNCANIDAISPAYRQRWRAVAEPGQAGGKTDVLACVVARTQRRRGIRVSRNRDATVIVSPAFALTWNTAPGERLPSSNFIRH